MQPGRRRPITRSLHHEERRLNRLAVEVCPGDAGRSRAAARRTRQLDEAPQARVPVPKDAPGLPFPAVALTAGVRVGTARRSAHRARAGVRVPTPAETGAAC